MKKYLDKSVYEATNERIKYIFDNFDNIYVSFSGGKDSGLLLNLVLDYKRRNNIKRKIGVFHQDFEAQYKQTTEFVTRMFENNLEDIDPYWVCLPMGSRCAVSNYQMYWYTWDPDEKDKWVREMPSMPYIINLNNNPFDFYKYKMVQEDLYADFADWFSRQHKGKSICLLGIRADESLNRFRAYANARKDLIDNKQWTTKMGKNWYNAYPLYDWTTKDVWIANGKYGFDYNKIYDLFYKAGLSIHQMRVVYRVLEPDTWVRVVGRVQGANFGAMYGNTKLLGSRRITLPKGHTWRSYVKFLLATLPDLKPSQKPRLEQKCRCAWNWITRFAPEEFRFSLRTADEEKPQADEACARVMADVRRLVAEKMESSDEKTFGELIYASMQENNVSSADFFTLMYRTLIGKEKGPRLINFMYTIGKEKLLKLL